MPAISIDVNHKGKIPFVKIAHGHACNIEFSNSNTADNRRVRFDPKLTPDHIQDEFIVENSTGTTFTVTSTAAVGTYTYDVYADSDSDSDSEPTGNGGIEIS